MAAYSTFTNLLRGEDHGDFHSLRFLRNGTHQEINAVLNGIGGGGGGAVSSATLPLSITNFVLSIDLSSYSNTVAMNTAISNVLAAYTDTTGLTTLLANKLDTLNAGSNVTITGSGASRTISTTGGSSLILQLDGVTQAAATTLDFVGNNASFANGVLSL